MINHEKQGIVTLIKAKVAHDITGRINP